MPHVAHTTRSGFPREPTSAILDALPDLIFRLRRDGTYLDFWGGKEFPPFVPPDRFLGRTMAEILPDEVARLAMDAIERVFETGQMQVLQYQLPENRGLRHYEARIVRSGEDEVITVVRDITERTQAEEALQRSQEALHRSREELRALAARLIAAQEDERRRVSRELHDDLNQKLAVLALEVEELRKLSHATPDRIQERVSWLQDRVTELSEDIHRIAYQLPPSLLDHLGLAVALESFADEFSQREGVRIRFAHRNVPESVPQDVASCLYRVAQEALRNVAKHSGATQAQVSLTGADGSLRLAVTDPGVGFDPEVVKGRGLGIVSMEERVRLVNGVISIRSGPGLGTRIEIRVPLRREE